MKKITAFLFAAALLASMVIYQVSGKKTPLLVEYLRETRRQKEEEKRKAEKMQEMLDKEHGLRFGWTADSPRFRYQQKNSLAA